jgi:hypothetical protein
LIAVHHIPQAALRDTRVLVEIWWALEVRRDAFAVITNSICYTAATEIANTSARVCAAPAH